MSSLTVEEDQRWAPTHVQVTVQRGRSLRGKGKHGTSDVYTIIQLGKEKYSTGVAEKTTEPEWHEECSFELQPGVLESRERSGYPAGSNELVLTVMHRALMGLDVFLGQAVIQLDKAFLETRCVKNQWYRLNSKTGKKEKERGDIQVTIQFTRNNLTASMYDLVMKDKGTSTFSKLKERMKGKRRSSDEDTSSAVLPGGYGSLYRMRQRLPSDGGGEEDYEDDEGGEVRRSKMRTFFLRGKLRKSSDTRSSTSLGSESSESSSRGGSLSPTAGISVVVSDLSNSPSNSSNFTADNSPEHPTNMSPKSSSLKCEIGEVTITVPQPVVCVNGSHVYSVQPPDQGSGKPTDSLGLGLLQKSLPLSVSLQNLSTRACTDLPKGLVGEGRRWSYDRAGEEEKAAIAAALEKSGPILGVEDRAVLPKAASSSSSSKAESESQGKKQRKNLFSHGRTEKRPLPPAAMERNEPVLKKLSYPVTSVMEPEPNWEESFDAFAAGRLQCAADLTTERRTQHYTLTDHPLERYCNENTLHTIVAADENISVNDSLNHLSEAPAVPSRAKGNNTHHFDTFSLFLETIPEHRSFESEDLTSNFPPEFSKRTETRQNSKVAHPKRRTEEEGKETRALYSSSLLELQPESISSSRSDTWEGSVSGKDSSKDFSVGDGEIPGTTLPSLCTTTSSPDATQDLLDISDWNPGSPVPLNLFGDSLNISFVTNSPGKDFSTNLLSDQSSSSFLQSLYLSADSQQYQTCDSHPSSELFSTAELNETLHSANSTLVGEFSNIQTNSALDMAANISQRGEFEGDPTSMQASSLFQPDPDLPCLTSFAPSLTPKNSSSPVALSALSPPAKISAAEPLRPTQGTSPKPEPEEIEPRRLKAANQQSSPHPVKPLTTAMLAEEKRELVSLLVQREAELEHQKAEFERQKLLLAKREVELKKLKPQVKDLEDYIDTLLVRIMEQKPTLLQVRSKLK
uniref:RAB11 family interacting protein 5a (Class I) n=1 Tax=Nothobranchius kadleci TaxID=1051664 RepID=A0A1A8C9V4_NOTKA